MLISIEKLYGMFTSGLWWQIITIFFTVHKSKTVKKRNIKYPVRFIYQMFILSVI